MIKTINYGRCRKIFSVACFILGIVVIVLVCRIAQIELKATLMGAGVAISGLGLANLGAAISYDLLKDVDFKVSVILSSIAKTKIAKSIKKGDQK